MPWPASGTRTVPPWMTRVLIGSPGVVVKRATADFPKAAASRANVCRHWFSLKRSKLSYSTTSVAMPWPASGTRTVPSSMASVLIGSPGVVVKRATADFPKAAASRANVCRRWFSLKRSKRSYSTISVAMPWPASGTRTLPPSMASVLIVSPCVEVKRAARGVQPWKRTSASPGFPEASANLRR